MGSSLRSRHVHRCAISLLRAMMSPLGIDGMLADAERAFRLAPPGNFWHLLAEAVLGVARLLSGSVKEATRLFEEVALLARGEVAAPELTRSLAQLSLLNADGRNVVSAHRQAARAWARAWETVVAANMGGDVTAVLAYLAEAKAALHRGDHESARQQPGAQLLQRCGHPVPSGEVAEDRDGDGARREHGEDHHHDDDLTYRQMRGADRGAGTRHRFFGLIPDSRKPRPSAGRR